MITVMGATGHTGGEVARLLLAAGERVRAIGRSPGKLAALERAGAEVRAGDAADPAFLTEALADAAAVYTLLPFDPGTSDHFGTQRRLGEAIVRAVRAAGVGHVVALSAIGADQPAGTGFIVSLHDQEERLRRLDGAAVLLLRSGLFFETFAAALPLIEREGVNADTVSPDVPLPMVATRDVAAVAAEALRARDWRGVVVREVLGQRDLTYREVTRILGERLGEPDLAYVRLPEADVAAALTQAGFSESAARLQVEMARAFNEGRVASREGRTAQSTTPTRFEDVAAELVRAYRAG